MKNKITLGLFLAAVLFYLLAKSQESPTSGPVNPLPDILYISQFDLTLSGTQAAATNTLLLGESEFFQKFNNPISSTSEYSEEQETSMSHYIYNGMEVWYLNNKIQAFNITSSIYAFQLTNGTTIRVGDNISSVVNLFLNSWNNVQFSGQVFISLRDQNGPVDMNLLFEYNLLSGTITGISVQE